MACTLSVRVLFFASVRELAGAAEAAVSFDGAPVTIATLLERLLQDYPQLSQSASGGGATSSLEGVSVAVNKQYARAEAFGSTLLHDGDEVALIPPISGG